VTTEVIERYMADLRARITPRVEKLSPEAAEAVDLELAEGLVDIKAIFGIGEAIFGLDD
jgi:hypothetical protein